MTDLLDVFVAPSSTIEPEESQLYLVARMTRALPRGNHLPCLLRATRPTPESLQ